MKKKTKNLILIISLIAIASIFFGMFGGFKLFSIAGITELQQWSKIVVDAPGNIVQGESANGSIVLIPAGGIIGVSGYDALYTYSFYIDDKYYLSYSDSIKTQIKIDNFTIDDSTDISIVTKNPQSIVLGVKSLSLGKHTLKTRFGASRFDKSTYSESYYFYLCNKTLIQQKYADSSEMDVILKMNCSLIDSLCINNLYTLSGGTMPQCSISRLMGWGDPQTCINGDGYCDLNSKQLSRDYLDEVNYKAKKELTDVFYIYSPSQVLVNTSYLEYLNMSIADQADYINSLNVTLQEKLSMVQQLQNNITYQAQLVAQLQLNLQEKIVAVQTLSSQIGEQAILIEKLGKTRDEQVVLIQGLNLQITQQAEMINALTKNLEEKAILVNQLQATNENQARLIAEMKLSFSDQAGIIDALDKKIGDDAIIIANLGLNLEGQGQVIANLSLTNAQQAQVIDALNLNLADQAKVIAGMKNTIDKDAEIIANLNLSLENEQKITTLLKSKISEQQDLLSKVNQEKIDMENKIKTQNMIIWGLGIAIAGLIAFLIWKRRK